MHYNAFQRFVSHPGWHKHDEEKETGGESRETGNGHHQRFNLIASDFGLFFLNGESWVGKKDA